MRLSGILVAILWSRALGFGLCSRLQAPKFQQGGKKYVGKSWENHWEKRGSCYEGPWLVEEGFLFSVVMS